ncbi:MAG: hypothetical protein ABIZ91_01810 [Gemmatimonadaceae bacterium]
MRHLRLVVLALSVAACYKATPLDTSNLRAGSEAELFLTDIGTLQLAPTLGAQLRSVRGKVAESNQQSIVLDVNMTTNRSGTEFIWRGERVTLLREYVQSSSLRTLDKKRTSLVVALTLLGVVLVGGLLGGGFGFDGFVGGTGGGRQ